LAAGRGKRHARERAPRRRHEWALDPNLDTSRLSPRGTKGLEYAKAIALGMAASCTSIARDDGFWSERTIRRRVARASYELDRGRLHGHDVRRIERAERHRGAARCAYCDARLYVDASTTPPIMDGEVFTEDCTATTATS